MSAPAWMPLYVADYLADTRRLSTIEHGAYMLLIMEYWRTEGKLPDDDDRLARIAGMTTKEWQQAKPTISEFFGPNWSSHKRIDEELTTARRISDAGRTAGRASAEARRKREAQRSSNDRSTTGERSGNHPPSPSPEEDSSSVGNSTPRAREASRIEREVRDALGSKAPPENADFSPIQSLIDDGYDPVKDVLAACRSAAEKAAGTIGSWQFYATAISRRPKANGKQSTATAWIANEDPRWPAIAAMYQRERTKPLIAAGSSHATGIGAFVPTEWLRPPADFSDLEIPEALRRT